MVKDEMPGNFGVFTMFQAAGWVCYYVVSLAPAGTLVMLE